MGDSPSMIPVTKSWAAVMLPLESTVALLEGVCEACDPAPVIMSVLVRELAAVTHVAQPSVPVEVMVPPVMGDVVAMLVTEPAPVPGARKPVRTSSIAVIAPPLVVTLATQTVVDVNDDVLEVGAQELLGAR